MLLNGVIDCPDIPLNVSRSFLQNDRQVQKISKHITKKVADKLTALFNNERERYNECWKDIATFIKFGCLKDDEFYDKVKDIVIFKNLEGDYKPLNDFLGEEVSDEDAGKGVQPKAVYYVSDEAQQAQYIALFKDCLLYTSRASGSAFRSEGGSRKRREIAFSFPRTYKIPPRRGRSNGEEGSTYSCTRSDEDG